MKRNLILIVSIWILSLVLSIGAIAQTSENLNSRSSVALSQVKGHLQDQCWYFPDFDINKGGWDPNIEGDGAMVSNPGASADQASGIYTPLLEVAGSINISFKYKFSNELEHGHRRWMKIYLTDFNNNILGMLDSVEFTNINTTTVYDYNKSFTAGSANYRVFISYQGHAGATRFALDDLNISASRVYSTGCNQAPVAVNDVLDGNNNRTANGFMCANDYDPNGDQLHSYVITNSPDGNVTINDDNSFTFTPNENFNGNSTTFTYQVCDQGFGPLCSNIATVTINFPNGDFLPISMIDFKGLYKSNGIVEISWTTNFETNSDKFEVERSLDGKEWKSVGTIRGQGISTVRHKYDFVDNVGRNTANKKDLYYRLKQVDMDKRTSVSRILVVRVYNTESVKMISVTPNPAKSDIMANIQLNQSSVVVMKIFTAAGKEMMRKSLNLGAGANSILMDGSAKLTPGAYVLEVIVNSKERMLVKLIKE